MRKITLNLGEEAQALLLMVCEEYNCSPSHAIGILLTQWEELQLEIAKGGVRQ